MSDNWIITYTGVKFDPFDIDINTIHIKDIAHSLSLTCRYGGHCKEFYSVAQHSVLVSRMCTHGNKLYGLLHDAGEAYLTDMPKPIKDNMPEFKKLEKYILGEVLYKYGLKKELPQEVKDCDYQMLLFEAPHLVSITGWLDDGKVYPMEPYMQPEEAEQTFLKEFKKLHEKDNQTVRVKLG